MCLAIHGLTVGIVLQVTTGQCEMFYHLPLKLELFYHLPLTL